MFSSANNVNATTDVFEEDDMDVSDHLACQPLETEPVPYEVSVLEYSKTVSKISAEALSATSFVTECYF